MKNKWESSKLTQSDEFCLFEVNEKRVIWEVTSYCNYRCKHCCASANKVDTSYELTTERSLSILDELKDFGIKEIYFSGGEPFSRKDILKILRKAVDNRYYLQYFYKWFLSNA